MSHPAIRLDAIARLRSRLGRTMPTARAVDVPADQQPVTRLRGLARGLAGRFAAPVLDRLGDRVSASARRDIDALRAESTELRAELLRLRSDLEADLALVRAESAGRSGAP